MKIISTLVVLFSLCVLSAQNNIELTVQATCIDDPVEGLVKVKSGEETFEEDLINGEAYFLLHEDISTNQGWLSLPYQLEIFPNPALQGIATLVLPQDQNLHIELFNLSGQKLGGFNSGTDLYELERAPSMILFRIWDGQDIVQQGKLLNGGQTLHIHMNYDKELTWSKLKSIAVDQTYEVEIYNENQQLLFAEQRLIGEGEHDTMAVNLCAPDTVYMNTGDSLGATIMRHDGSGVLGGNNDWAWIGGGNTDRHLYMYFDETFLVNEGDQIILTVNYTAGLGAEGLNINNNTPLAFRIGLFNNNGTEVATNSGLQDNGFMNYEGYYAGYSILDEHGISIFERDPGHTNLILGNQDVNIGSGSADTDMLAEENRTFKLIIEKTSNGNSITMVQDGSGSFDYTANDNADVESVFNTIALGFDDTPELLDWYYIDYINVVRISNSVEPRYALEVQRGTGSGLYKELESVTIRAEDAHEDSIFSHWAGDTIFLDDPQSKSSTFSMPDASLSFKAVYKEKSAFVSWPLFIYNFGGLENLSIADQIDLVHTSGYQGLAVRVTNQTQLDNLDTFFSITESMNDFEIYKVFFRYNFNASATDRNRWKALMEKIKGKGIDLWFIFGRPQNGVTDETIRTVLREVVDSAEVHQVPVTLYPHHFDVIETAEEALPFVQQMNSPYLDLAVHSCHEIRSGNGGRIEEVIDNVKDYMGDVTIAGSDSIVDFSTAFTIERSTIKPLDEGSYDITRILRKLKEIGYDKEVGFINHIIPESVQTYVPRSYTTWQDMLEEINK